MTTSLALAIDFGGTKVEAALIDETGRLLPGSRHRAPTGRQAASAELERSVREVVASALDAAPADSEIVGAGIGTAGPIVRNQGLASPLNVPAWRGYPLREFVAGLVESRGHRVPVRLEVDGVAITLAEHWIGAAQGVENVMGMVISTGIGAGLIVGGRVLTGSTGNAGHVGHVDVAGFTGEATFGATSSLEAIASGPHTVAWAQHHGFEGAAGEDLAAAYAAGDEVARAAIARTGEAVGRAIASATALLDLDLVAIGGGFSQSTPDLFDQIRRPLRDHYFEFVRKVRVVPSALSGEGPLIGSGALIHRSDMLPAITAAEPATR